MTNDGGRLWVEEEQDLRESFHHVHSSQVLDLVTVLSIQQFELLKKKKNLQGNSLTVQWLRLWAFTAEASGSISGQGTKISQSVWHNENKKASMEI